MSTKSPPFCMTTFSASLTKLMVLLSLSHYCSYYVSRPILATPSLWMHTHTVVRTQEFAHSPDLWHQPRLADVTCVWSWRLCGINPLTQEIIWSGSSLFLFYNDYFYTCIFIHGVAQWLRHCATSRVVPGSNPGGVGHRDFSRGYRQNHVPWGQLSL